MCMNCRMHFEGLKRYFEEKPNPMLLLDALLKNRQSDMVVITVVFFVPFEIQFALF